MISILLSHSVSRSSRINSAPQRNLTLWRSICLLAHNQDDKRQFLTNRLHHRFLSSDSKIPKESLVAVFEKSVKMLQTSQDDGNSNSGNDVKLKMYGLYKQATQGPSTSSPSGRPGMFDMVGRAKFDAWKSYDNLSKDEAMEMYIKEIQKILNVSLDQILATVAAPAAPAKVENSSNTASQHVSKYPKSIREAYFPRSESGYLNNLKLDTILSKVDSNGVAEIILNRPSRGNSFNYQMWTDYLDVFDAVKRDSSARVVVLSGALAPSKPPSFSTGMDLSVFMEFPKIAATEKCEGRKREALYHFIQYLQDSVSASENCVVPVIAKINGQCIGGAVDIITACDLRYCTKDSSFSIKETDIGMVADIGTLQRLPGLIGQQRCRELAYTARTFYGKEAEEMGLVAKCFDTAEEMDKHVAEVALTIAKKSPITIRGLKKVILYKRDHTTVDSLEQIKLWNSAVLENMDLQIAIMAAMNKSVPEFKRD